MNRFLIHYGEIALKGRNRPIFERALVENIKKALKSNALSVQRLSGRLLLKTRDDEETVSANLKAMFGIANFAQVEEILYQDAQKSLLRLSKRIVDVLGRKKFKSFRIDASRGYKEFPLDSQQINERIGADVVQKLKKQVKLKNPDVTVFVEVLSKQIFFYFEKIKGAGGLPVGTSGALISMISGGIDSPVASWYMMKRGARIVFVHFHSYPLTSKESQDNVKELILLLAKWQNTAKLYLVPFGDLQKEIVKHVDSKYRLLFYRRYMVRIAEEIAKKENARGLITGESLGQVASQTLENLNVVNTIATFPIYRPLIGFDKEEIVQKAKEIGTYEISIRPYDDCCSFLVPEHPETRANIAVIAKQEKTISSKLIGLAGLAIANAEMLTI